MAAMLDQPPHLLTRVISTPATSIAHRVLLYAVVVALLIRCCRFIYKDYYAFLALGPGGTPSTFSGYVRVSLVRFFGASFPAFVQQCLMAHRLPESGHADPEIIISFAFSVSRIPSFRPQYCPIYCQLRDISFEYLVALVPDRQ